LMPSSQFEADQLVISDLDQELFSENELVVLDSGIVDSVNRSKSFFIHAENLSQTVDKLLHTDRIATQVQQKFSHCPVQYQEKIFESLKNKALLMQQSVLQQAQLIYDQTKMPGFESWDDFFKKYSTWSIFSDAYQANIKSAQLLKCEAMRSFREFFMLNLKKLPLTLSEESGSLFFEKNLAYDNVSFIKKWSNYLQEECKAICSVDEEYSKVWVERVFKGYLNGVALSNDKPLEIYWDQELLDFIKTLAMDPPVILLSTPLSFSNLRGDLAGGMPAVESDIVRLSSNFFQSLY